jgi:hypothetical protein
MQDVGKKDTRMRPSFSLRVSNALCPGLSHFQNGRKGLISGLIRAIELICLDGRGFEGDVPDSCLNEKTLFIFVARRIRIARTLHPRQKPFLQVQGGLSRLALEPLR